MADVEGSQPAREELVLGPPAAAAFGADGAPTPAEAGFARKQGVGRILNHGQLRAGFIVSGIKLEQR